MIPPTPLTLEELMEDIRVNVKRLSEWAVVSPGEIDQASTEAMQEMEMLGGRYNTREELAASAATFVSILHFISKTQNPTPSTMSSVVIYGSALIQRAQIVLGGQNGVR